MISKLIVTAATAALLVGGTAHAADAAPTAKSFQNCTQMNKTYAHGVGRTGARDHVTSGSPVTNFKVSTSVYNANKKSDRDGDGVACEKH